MKLKEYLEREERSARWMATKIGCHYLTILNVIKGKGSLRISTAKRIEEFTKKEVTVAEMHIAPHRCPACKRIMSRGIKQVKNDVVKNEDQD